MAGETSFRGCVVGKWEADGSPEWVEYNRVLDWAIECDSDFESRGLNPAPVLREHIKNRDKGLRSYLRGNRFHFDFSNRPNRRNRIL